MPKSQDNAAPTTPEIEELMKLVVQHVRDGAIATCDMLLQPKVMARTAVRWRKAVRKGPLAALREAIPDIVDDTLFFLLDGIDNGCSSSLTPRRMEKP